MWPGSYPWHDGNTNHHFAGHGPGGVLISRKLSKADVPQQHPHTYGPPQEQPPKNEQAGGVGVKGYHQFALPFGRIDQEAKARGGTNLVHYDYRGKTAQVDRLLQDHGYTPYYFGGKYGKPDLSNRNYNTKHLAVFDPTPGSGGDFGDEEQTANWRKVHELAHALVYPELNRIYGEGRRIGKLGHHRTLREATRAVHWEDLAVKKQRELNRQLGIEVPDEVFNREYNTTLHDALFRATHGVFTEPSQEGFVPHSHRVPLDQTLGMLAEQARVLGLKGQHDLLPKGTPVRKSHQPPNLSPQEQLPVADDPKSLTIPEALHRLHKGLREQVTAFEQKCVELRKAELEKKSPPGRKEEVEKLKSKGLPASEAFGIAWKQNNQHGEPKVVKKDEPGNVMGMDGGGSPSMAMSELCKMCGVKKSDAGHMCDKAEAYAKGELKPKKGGSKTVLGHGMSPEALAADTEQSDREYIAQRQKREKERAKKAELEKANPVVAARMAANKAKAKAAQSPPPPKPPEPAQKAEVVPAPKKVPDNGEAKPKLGKAAMSSAAAGMPTAPAAPKPAGGMPKAPKLPGSAGPKMPKAAGPAAPKTPPMGAGSPQMKGEKELASRAKCPHCGESVPISGGKFKEHPREMSEGKAPPGVSPDMWHGQPCKGSGCEVKMAKTGISPRDVAADKAKRPAAAASAGALMDNMLAGGSLKPGQPLSITPIASNPVAPAGGAQATPTGSPKGHVQSMVERAASRMPAGGPAAGLTPPPAGQKSSIPGMHLFGGAPASPKVK